MKKNSFKHIIDNKYSLIDSFVEIFLYKDLIYIFIKRDFKVFYKQTLLGPIWYVIQPLLNTIVFTLIFNRIADLPTNNAPPFLFYMSGLIIWSYFSICLQNTSNLFTDNKALFEKVYFPRMTVPISIVLINLMQFFIQFIFFICFLVYYSNDANINLSINLIYLPLVLIEIAILGLGIGLILSSLTSKYKDLSLIVSFIIQLGMFLSPIAYPSSMVPENLRFFYNLNPIAPIIEFFKSMFFLDYSISYFYLLTSFITSILIFILGLILFLKTEKNFADTV